MSDSPTPPKAKNIGKGAVSVIAFVLAFLAVRTFIQQSNEEKVVKAAAEKLETMKAQAQREKPDVPVAITMQENASKEATSKINAESGIEKTNTAADMYFGFLYVNTSTRPAFCKTQGVEIPAWITAFEKIHSAETARATQNFANRGIDSKSFYAKLNDSFMKFIVLDMNGIATQYKLSLPDACKLFQDHANELASAIELSKAQPAVYKALMTQ
jgi:hypothetical protein